LAALRTAAAEGRHQLVVDVAEAMQWYCDTCLSWRGWYDVFGMSRAAAAALPDQHRQIFHLNAHSWAAAASACRFEEAVDTAREALRRAEAIGDLDAQAFALLNMGQAWRLMGRTEDALEAYRASRDLADRVGNHDIYVQQVQGIAMALEILERFDDAI